MQWFATHMDFLLDGVLYYTRTAGEVDMPPYPMYIIFDQAVSQFVFAPPFPPPAPYLGAGVTMLVDWVRVYTAAATGAGAL